MSPIRRDFPDRPPIWALGFAAASVAVGRLLPPGPFEDPFYRYLGIYLIIGGIAFAGWAVFWFRRKHTVIAPRNAPTSLIVEGPFRINRNPIYSGMALAVFGAAFAAGGILSFAIAALFPIVIGRRFIDGEEAALHAAFGAQADAFFRRTRRW